MGARSSEARASHPTLRARERAGTRLWWQAPRVAGIRVAAISERCNEWLGGLFPATAFRWFPTSGAGATQDYRVRPGRARWTHRNESCPRRAQAASGCSSRSADRPPQDSPVESRQGSISRHRLHQAAGRRLLRRGRPVSVASSEGSAGHPEALSGRHGRAVLLRKGRAGVHAGVGEDVPGPAPGRWSRHPLHCHQRRARHSPGARRSPISKSIRSCTAFRGSIRRPRSCSISIPGRERTSSRVVKSLYYCGRRSLAWACRHF